MSSNVAGPGSQTSLREANSLRVVDTIRRFGSITQVEIAAATGLSQATISNIVKRLVNDGVLETENTIRSGRRAQLVKFVRQTGLVAGVQIGVRQLRVEVSDMHMELTQKKALPLPVDHRVDTTLDRTALMIVDLAEAMGATLDEVLAIGVSVPAPVEPETQMISVRGIMPGWEDTDIASVMTNRLRRPVVVDNDANAAVLAEARHGALRGHGSGMFVRVSYGTGAGVLIHDQVYRGRRGIVGEIGHVQVDPTGLICQCGGRGCLNTVVGADVIVDSLRLSRGPRSIQDVIREALEGDPGCRQVISDAGTTIGAVLADQALTFEPDKIVVGGELAATGELLVSPIREAVTSRPIFDSSTQVELSELGERAEVVGALTMAIDLVEQSAAAGTIVEGANQ